MTENAAVIDRTDTEASAVPNLRRVGPGYGQEIRSWLDEIKRLVAETEQRLDEAAVLPALSSLAAIPPLHHMLIGRCSELLNEEPQEEPSDTSDPCGMYL